MALGHGRFSRHENPLFNMKKRGAEYANRNTRKHKRKLAHRGGKHRRY